MVLDPAGSDFFKAFRAAAAVRHRWLRLLPRNKLE
jgi:hypothetical protein